MSEIQLQWITRVETPSSVTIYVSRDLGQLFLADRRLEAGGSPLAGVDLTNPLSAELPDLADLTRQFVAARVDPTDPSFVPVFDFGHEATAAIMAGKHAMAGLALVGSPEELLTQQDFEAGRASAVPAGGGVELVPITPDLGPLIAEHPRSHLALVLAESA
jgi:hypothetical protein